MNLKNIFAMQKELDQKIAQRKDLALNKIKTNNKHQQMMLATLIEIAEFVNEVQSFKYWKKHKYVDKDKILEEFADVLHFLGSLGYKYHVDEEIEPLIVNSKNINEQFTLLFSAVTKAMSHTNKYNISEIFALVLGSAKLLNYSEKEILEAYEKKNLKNHQRIIDNY
ncbi:dUTP diphosphatase [Mycoplasma sp. 1018B]|uniref:dUTP diphosphatase n=1 Tax=Mycoplasma sp. 1018B TaxID=2967302 RepID=UPI00211C48A0|nr:dUTP diphosphatase [Mycoplasma sp. 1018B]UUM19458.1 dUTP diphosphatase [Mycoplasma sp. 1018B]